MNDKRFFTENLLRWNDTQNNRTMPWKGEKNPYKIWISEIILQQTRVQQGLEYYNRFIKKFPSVHHIANAPQASVFKAWEGLGYYTRCKNIIDTATFISKELNGKFPDKFDDILKLKGIGIYTASAIASFAYDLPFAVVDGNVYRVLSRYFGMNIPIDSTLGKQTYNALATELLDKKSPAIYNQSIMDFGATVCKPQPLCFICPLQKRCIAYSKGLVDILPIKEKNIKRTKRWMYYIKVEQDKNVYIRKRITKDIWQNLYEFILFEGDKPLALSQLQSPEFYKNIFGSAEYKIESISKIYSQQLTHQSISGRLVSINLKQPLIMKEYEQVTQKQLKKLPFPKFINRFLQE